MEPMPATPVPTAPSADAAREPVSIIVPTYNESRNLPVLAERVHAALTAACRPYELVVVDDDSPDRTGEVGQALASRFPVRVLVRTEERGLATAVIRGMEHAKHDVCVCMDADLSHPPEVIPALCDAIAGGATFALGSRYVDGGATRDWSPLRLVNSIGATWLARPLSPVRDPMSGFFAVRRSTVPLAELNPIGYKIALEILVKSRIQAPVEVPITFTDRLHGESKLTHRERMRYLQHLERLYRWRYPTVTQLGWFVGVGSVGLIVDFIVLSFGVEWLGWWFGTARLPAFVAAVSTNFLLNDRYTFRTQDLPARAPTYVRYARFVGGCLLGWVVNWSVATVLYESSAFFREHYLFAALLGVFTGTTINFLASKHFAFREERP